MGRLAYWSTRLAAAIAILTANACGATQMAATSPAPRSAPGMHHPDIEVTSRVYPVADLALPPSPPLWPGEPWGRYGLIVSLITSTVAPDCWEEVGGAGRVVACDGWDLLVVEQTPEVQEQVAALLAAVRKARQAALAAPPQAADYAPVPVVSESAAAASAKLSHALDQVVSLEFHATPLGTVVAHLQQTYQIPIVLDQRSLNDVGLSRDMPVTFSLQGVTLRNALRFLLREYDLMFLEREGVLKITTPEEPEEALTVLLYPIPDFVPLTHTDRAGGDGEAIARVQCAELVHVIQTEVAPDSWDWVGGAGALESILPWRLLVVSQSRYLQAEVTDLLQTMRRTRRASVTSPGTPGPGGLDGGVTTREPASDPAMVLQFYPVRAFDLESTIRLIQGTIAPETWGPAARQGAIFPLGRGLLIRQTRAAHVDIQDWFRDSWLYYSGPYGLGGFGGGMGGMGGMGGWPLD